MDTISTSNLNRQFLFCFDEDKGKGLKKYKAEVIIIIVSIISLSFIIFIILFAQFAKFRVSQSKIVFTVHRVDLGSRRTNTAIRSQY